MDAILLPGAILPTDIAYESLLGAFDSDVTARAKELEVYATDGVPPAGYGLDTEVAGIIGSRTRQGSIASTSSGIRPAGLRPWPTRSRDRIGC